MRKYRVIELFSGVGAQRMALERLARAHPDKVEFEYVAQCDIDRHSIASYNAIHGETPNLGDISKVEKLPDCDILTWSFPCQDLSQAGKKEGMSASSGTRSALCWEVVRLLGCSHRPEWLVMENVPAILFKTNIKEFERLVASLVDLGYDNKYGVLNATEFDVAQNRKRCFMVSHLNAPSVELPVGTGLKHKLRDYLEDDVDSKYFLSKERLKGLIYSTQKEREREVTDSDSRSLQQTVTQRQSLPERAVGSTTTSSSPIRVATVTQITFYQRSQVFSDKGTCPTIGAHDVSHTPKVLIKRDE